MVCNVLARQTAGHVAPRCQCHDHCQQCQPSQRSQQRRLTVQAVAAPIVVPPGPGAASSGQPAVAGQCRQLPDWGVRARAGSGRPWPASLLRISVPLAASPWFLVHQTMITLAKHVISVMHVSVVLSVSAFAVYAWCVCVCVCVLARLVWVDSAT